MRLPSLGHRIDVNGQQLWMHRSGTGDPVVVFVAGGGAFGLDYLLAHDRVAEFTTSVLYDRAATGWSDDVPLPRTLDQVTDELRALLRVADLPRPYVLVGHSLGGAYVQRYAQRFPDEVAALLLLEPAHPDYDDYMPDHLKLANAMTDSFELPELTDEFAAQVREVITATFAGLPDSVREQVIEKHLSAERLPTGLREGTNFLALFEELRAGGPLPDVPLIVLSGTGSTPTRPCSRPKNWSANRSPQASTSTTPSPQKPLAANTEPFQTPPTSPSPSPDQTQ